MAKQRIIDTRFWADDYVDRLDPIEKLLFLYLLTNPYTDISGVYEIPLKNIAVDTGIELTMVRRILSRFTRDKRVYYKKGWVGIVNFTKHQTKNPKVIKGIENGLNKAPIELVEKMNIDNAYSIDSLSHSNSNSNLNSNSNSKDTGATAPFSLQEEIKKLEESNRRDMNIIALYLEHRKPDLQTKEQYQVAIKRHLRPAGQLKPFTDEQIIKALNHAKKEYADVGWTIETLVKILTK